MKVSFKNTNMNRELGKVDFERLGVDYDEDVVWTEQNHFIVELPNDVATKLIETWPDEFEEYTIEAPAANEVADLREEAPDASDDD